MLDFVEEFDGVFGGRDRGGVDECIVGGVTDIEQVAVSNEVSIILFGVSDVASDENFNAVPRWWELYVVIFVCVLSYVRAPWVEGQTVCVLTAKNHVIKSLNFLICI